MLGRNKILGGVASQTKQIFNPPLFIQLRPPPWSPTKNRRSLLVIVLGYCQSAPPWSSWQEMSGFKGHPQDNSTIAVLLLNYVSHPPPPAHHPSRCLPRSFTRALSAPCLSSAWSSPREDGPTSLGASSSFKNEAT